MQELERPLSFIHPGTLSGAPVYAGVFALIGLVASLAIRGVGRCALRHDSVDRMAIAILRPLAEVAVWLTLGVAYAHLIPGLRSLGTAMLAGASVASIVLGVAAQNTLGNLIAGLALLLYRPFQVGDRLQVQGPGGIEVGVSRFEYAVYEEAKNRFAEAGIEIPYPYRNVIVTSRA